MESFKNRVAKARLTSKEAAIAEFILNNTSKVCFYSAKDLARVINTSDATVNRMARALGYNAYSSLQKELQNTISENVDFVQTILGSPLERLITQETTPLNNSTNSQFLDLMFNNIRSVFIKNTDEKIDSVIHLLENSEHKYIAGQRPTADIANKLGFLLRMIIDKVVVLTDACIFERLLDINEKDCLFIIDFDPYSLLAKQTMEYAKARNAKIILMTDRTTSNHGYLADELLVVDVFGMSFFNSNVAPFFLMEFICTKLANSRKVSTKQRLNILEPYFTSRRLKLP